MKRILYALLLMAIASCNNRKLVNSVFIDNLLSHSTPSKSAIVNQQDLEFWEKRVQSTPENFVNLSKYSSALAVRFHIYGNISDLLTADSVMQ